MRIDITGLRFGRLTVLGYAGSGRWICRCDCGHEAHPSGKDMRSGNTQSCGCLSIETASKLARRRNWRHGYSSGRKMTPEYRAWCAAKNRCYNPRNGNFKNYGARGIAVTEEWLGDFIAFYKYVGPRTSPKHSLGRIDNERGYEPGNVRWETRTQQNSNRRKRCSGPPVKGARSRASAADTTRTQ
jgi:hypothetical protein